MNMSAAISMNKSIRMFKLYSTEKLAELHPGGPLFVKVDLLCAKNTTVPNG